MKYLKKFNNHTEYEEAKQNLILPNVSLIEENMGVHYNPYVPPYAGFCKLTLNDGSVVELKGSGGLTHSMISAYESTVVSAEIGTQCISIGESAFQSCTSLTSVTIPDSVTSIGQGAFNGCSNLTSIVIPDSVTSIGNWAFYYCTRLTSVTIPDSVTSIGVGVFAYCGSLTSIDIPSGVTSIGGDAFRNCTSLTSINIPSGVTSIGGDAFAYCVSLTSCTIGNGVTSIGNQAFSYCTRLTSIASNAMTAPTIQSDTFQSIKTSGTLTVPSGSTGYDVWMGTSNYYLGSYNWTKVEQ